jgi:hypothetical protein
VFEESVVYLEFRVETFKASLGDHRVALDDPCAPEIALISDTFRPSTFFFECTPEWSWMWVKLGHKAMRAS